MNKTQIKAQLFAHFNITDCKQLKKLLPEDLKTLDLRKKTSWLAIAEAQAIELSDAKIEKPKPPAVGKAAKKEQQLTILKKLVYSEIDQWERNELEKLGVQCLSELCCLLGIRHTGTRADIIELIEQSISVRVSIRHYKEPVALAAAHKGSQLKQWCKIAKAFAKGNKFSMATALLNWRNECRKKGQEFWKQAIAIRKAKAL